MKITELLSSDKPTLSFEVFPPKTAQGYESVRSAALEIAKLRPSFMSVTFGAGGGSRSRFTLDISTEIQNETNVPALTHFTCVASTKEGVDEALAAMKERGLENVLALRGDLPKDMDSIPEGVPFRHANELTAYISERTDFCIGGACYPECHPEAANKKEDIANIRKKVEAGCGFLTTQMFFDNSIMYNYLYRLRDAGIEVPVCAGIMPITNIKQVETSRQLSGCIMPAKFTALVDRFGDDPKAMTQAGIAYATEQIIDLIANGVNHIHVYSMNKPSVAKAIRDNLSDIIVL
ncbi:MAG: methylenetetrahydrofolate reductase [Lachnospiraceae bacterium]|nr:methylenetetrahydrofolate reductase [Lachnospiraceae bacterium]